MADVTWGVKVPEELRDQISAFMKESGMQGKDFMQQLINLYVVEQTKDSIPEVAEDLKELQSLTQRINDIYLNIGYRIDNLVKSKDNEMIKELSKKDKIIEDLQGKNEDKNIQYNNLMDIYSNVVNSEYELKEQVNQLIGNLDDIKALNDEYKDKINTLANIIDEYKSYKTENDELKIEINKLTNKTEKLYSEINTKNANIKDLNIENQNLSISHEKEINGIKKELELEKEKIVLELKKEYQNTINKLQEDYNKKVKEYQNRLDIQQKNYNSKLEEYQNKYLDLLDKKG